MAFFPEFGKQIFISLLVFIKRKDKNLVSILYKNALKIFFKTYKAVVTFNGDKGFTDATFV